MPGEKIEKPESLYSKMERKERKPAKTFREAEDAPHIPGAERTKVECCGIDDGVDVYCGPIVISMQTHNCKLRVVDPPNIDESVKGSCAGQVFTELSRSFEEMIQVGLPPDLMDIIMLARTIAKGTNYAIVRNPALFEPYATIRQLQHKSITQEDADIVNTARAAKRERSAAKRNAQAAGRPAPSAPGAEVAVPVSVPARKAKRETNFLNFQFSITIRTDSADRSIPVTRQNCCDLLRFAPAKVFIPQDKSVISICIVGIKRRQDATHIFETIANLINTAKPLGLTVDATSTSTAVCSLQACRFAFTINSFPPGTDIFDGNILKSVIEFISANRPQIMQYAARHGVPRSEMIVEEGLSFNDFLHRSGKCFTIDVAGHANPFRFEIFNSGVVSITGGHDDAAMVLARSLVMRFISKYICYFILVSVKGKKSLTHLTIESSVGAGAPTEISTDRPTATEADFCDDEEYDDDG
jgi:hypothetical protein